MGAIGPWQILIVVILAVVLFGGRGRISSIMGDFAQGIKAFRKGLADEEKAIEDDKKADGGTTSSMDEAAAREEIKDKA